MSRTAEIAYARYNLLTPAQVAERLSEKNITDDTVRGWIEDGDLQAADFRRAGAKKPVWFLDWEWVEAFMRKRTRNAA